MNRRADVFELEGLVRENMCYGVCKFFGEMNIVISTVFSVHSMCVCSVSV